MKLKTTLPWMKVLPYGWMVHLYAPWHRRDTFCIWCANVKVFRGVDWTVGRWRFIILRINHLSLSQIQCFVHTAERHQKR